MVGAARLSWPGSLAVCTIVVPIFVCMSRVRIIGLTGGTPSEKLISISVGSLR